MKYQDLFQYQTEAMQLLMNAYQKQKLVHAYLFDGETGTGTTDAAIYMAKKLICKSTDSPCMECDDCKRIDARTHFNFLYIAPEGDMIKKEQIERLIHEFSMSSFEDGPQVYIIQDAEKMNTAAANSLLKFLEEPNPNHYAILTTTNEKKLLDTIVSRCQLIHFKPVPKTYLMGQLKNCGVDTDIAYLVSFLTTELDVAMKYIEEGKITNFLNIAKKIVDKDIKHKDPYVEYYRNRSYFLEEKDKTYHRFFLDILILMYQELLKRTMNDGQGYFEDIFQHIKLEDVNKDEIIRKLERINVYQERLNYYVNLDLQYTSLFAKL